MILLVLFIIFSFFCIGISALKVLSFSLRSSFFLTWGLSFGLGVMAIILEMLIFSLLLLPIHPLSLLFPWIIVGVIFFLRFRKKIELPKIPAFPKSYIEQFLVILLIGLVFFVGLQAILRPPMGWDAIATWLLQAKAFYYAGGLFSGIYQYAQFDSPPGIGLLLSFCYAIAGNVIDRETLLVFTAFYLALLFLLYGAIRDFTDRRTAIVFVFLYATLQSAIRQAGRFEAGYVDLSISYFFFSSAYLLLKFKLTKKTVYLLLAGIFAGGGALIKNEGAVFFILFFLLATFIIFRMKQVRLLLYLSAGVLIFLSWQLYKLTNTLHVSYYSYGHFVPDRIGLIIRPLLLEMLRIDRWNFLWIFLVSCVLFLRKRIIFFIPFQLFILQLLGYIFIYMFTPLDPVDHIVGSFDRLLLQLAPLAIFSSAVCAYGILKKTLIFRDY